MIPILAASTLSVDSVPANNPRAVLEIPTSSVSYCQSIEVVRVVYTGLKSLFVHKVRLTSDTVLCLLLMILQPSNVLAMITLDRCYTSGGEPE